MEDLYNRIYKGKKVLVTGHTGFKGSWLSLWLKRLGAEVIGYSLEPDTIPNHIELLKLDLDSNYGDIRDKEHFSNFVKTTNPDIVFHLAAQSLVKYSFDNPLETYETNFLGTLNLLESCREVPALKAIICITTDKVYENFEKIEGYKEEERLGGYDPYSSSKACVELMINSYRNSFFNLSQFGKKHQVLIATTRAGNVIGGGDWSKDRLVPDIIKSCVNGQSFFIRNPHGVRPWQHVLEPLSGYLELGAKLLEKNKEYSGAWNFGPESNRLMNNMTLAKECIKHWNEIKIELADGSNFHETNVLMVNSDKAMLNLNWRPRWSYEEAIKETVIWYKEFYENDKCISEKQITEFSKLL